jgi:predicted Zn-dependent protease
MGFLILLPLVSACSRYAARNQAPIESYKENEEVRISREFHREAKKRLKFVRNLEVERYIDQIGKQILSVMGPQPFDYRFFVVEDRELNAFAVPGGSIYVHTGLIEKAKSTDELAAVLGHEIVHIKARHMARMSGLDVLSLVGLLGIFLGGGSGAQAAGALGQALAVSRQLAYNRQLEQEADTLGVKYITQAGYDPAGALKFLKIVDQERGLNPVDVPKYLLSHPVTQERIANVENTIRSFRLEGQRSTPVTTDSIKKIQILIRLERNETNSVLSDYERLEKQFPDSAEPKYLLALAYQHSGALEKARASLERARASNPGIPGIDRDLGRLYFQSGEPGLAWEFFERSLKKEPKEPLTYIYLGELFEQQEKFTDAVGAYLTAQQISPLWAEPPQRLGMVYGKMKRLGDAYYYLGRSQMLQDENDKAIFNLERALKIFGPASPRGEAIQEELELAKSRR